jgi:hypothetical protein
MSRSHAERGQVLPLWIVAILTTFALMFMTVNYGNTLRWQMRAQNAADAAAQGLVAIQTQHFNEMTALLYASNVEEFRSRSLLDGMLNSLDGAGGCSGAPPSPKATAQATFTPGAGTCDQVFSDLMPYFEESVVRYTNDLTLLNNVAALTTTANWQSDMTSLTTHLDSATQCNTTTTTTVVNDRGDCQFEYKLNGSTTRSGLNAVTADAYTFFLPTQGMVPSNNAETENATLFRPGVVDVVVCAKIPPLIPLFGALNAKTHYVIGRAGATAVQSGGEWLQPGAVYDPARGSGTNILFQPPETYSTADSGLAHDWYGVIFGGTNWGIASFADPNIPARTDYAYTSSATNTEMDAMTGWWSAIPYDPRKAGGPTPTIAQDCPP